MDAGVLVSILSALGIGSFIGQYFSGAHQRRTIRSEVLANLAKVEDARWAREEPHEPPFQEAMHNLETSALIARIPRKAIVHYRALAYAAWWMSTESFDEGDDPRYAGGISGNLANATRVAAGEISRLAWSPWTARIQMNKRLREQTTAAAAITDTGVSRTLQRAREHVGY
jgi:hypothetical protein